MDVLPIYYHTGIYFSEKKIWKVHKIHLNKETLGSSITHFKKKPPEVFYTKAVLKNLAIFTTRKHLWWSLFLIKLQTLRPAALLKRDSNKKSLRTCWRIVIKISNISWKIIFSRNLETWNKIPLLIDAVLGTWTLIFSINLKLVFLLFMMLQCFMLIFSNSLSIDRSSFFREL